MKNSFTIKSTNGKAQLELKPHDKDSFVANLQDVTLNASAGICHFGGDGIDGYFKELADNWMGWTGTKQWESLESTLRFEASSDRTGHITLNVQLDEGTPYDWRLKVILIIEAGQLEKISSDARNFAISIGAA